MIVKEWIKLMNYNVPKFCKLIDVTPPTIYMYLKGGKRLSADTAVKIEEATDGQVTRLEAMWPELFDDKWTLNKEFYRYARKKKKEGEQNAR